MKKIFLMLIFLVIFSSCSFFEEIRNEIREEMNEALVDLDMTIGNLETFVVSEDETNPLVGNWRNEPVAGSLDNRESQILTFLPDGELWVTTLRRIRTHGRWSAYDSMLIIDFRQEHALSEVWTYSISGDTLTLEIKNENNEVTRTMKYSRMP
jgi:hypothetical protein